MPFNRQRKKTELKAFMKILKTRKQRFIKSGARFLDIPNEALTSKHFATLQTTVSPLTPLY